MLFLIVIFHISLLFRLNEWTFVLFLNFAVWAKCLLNTYFSEVKFKYELYVKLCFFIEVAVFKNVLDFEASGLGASLGSIFTDSWCSSLCLRVLRSLFGLMLSLRLLVLRAEALTVGIVDWFLASWRCLLPKLKLYCCFSACYCCLASIAFSWSLMSATISWMVLSFWSFGKP